MRPAPGGGRGLRGRLAATPGEPVPASPDTRRLPLRGPLAVAALVALSHLVFLLRDGAPPRDLSLAWTLLPPAHADVGAWDPGVLALLVTPTGWPQLVMAVWLQIVGPSAFAFRVLDVPWSFALVGLVGAAAAAVAPEARRGAAGTIGALLAAGTPLLVLPARVTWLHVPEAALVLGAALPWLRDPRLGRGLGWTAGLGALALLLRPSALPWLGLLAAAVLVGRGGARPPWRRLVAVAAAWGLACIPMVGFLPEYLAAKAGARAGYAAHIPTVLRLVLEGGRLPGLVLVAGAGLGLWQARAGRGLLSVWALATVALAAGSRAGPDNFLVGVAALAVLGGVGLARWPRPGAVTAGLLTLGQHALPLGGPPAPGTAHAALTDAFALPPPGPLGGRVWPLRGFGEAELNQLLDATCPASGACALGVDRGLAWPETEDPGQLGAFLLDRPGLVLRSTRRPRAPDGPRSLHALVLLTCLQDDARYRHEEPATARALDAWVRVQRLAPAWVHALPGGCELAWLTPGGAVRDPSALPPGGAVPPGWRREIPARGPP